MTFPRAARMASKNLPVPIVASIFGWVGMRGETSFGNAPGQPTRPARLLVYPPAGHEDTLMLLTASRACVLVLELEVG